MGKVYLIGAGPGDLDLLTIKAERLIKEADCLVYDRLVDPYVLNMVKDSCELHYVGKMNRHHTLKQDEINQLLVDMSKIHKKVVRLKGGDVYVFGRGGEEGLFLKEHNVEFEVVPGLSSSIAGLAYAGIPITHRGIATGFNVVTAHNKQDELADIDFEAMARNDNTCVFLMGLSKVGEIVKHLIDAGKNPNTPICLISNATLPKQDVVVGNLSNILDKLNEHPLPSPALIVVGDVINLRNDLNFFENKPLFKTKILLTKVGNQSDELYRKLKDLGADIQLCQISKLVENKECLANADICLYDFSYLVFGSKNAIDYFFKQMKTNHLDMRNLINMEICCVGKKCADYLYENYGLLADIVPNEYNNEALIDILKPMLCEDDKVLFPKVKGVNNKLIKEVAKICQIQTLDLYESVEIENAIETLDLNNLDYAVFNCASSVKRLFKQMEDYQEILKDTKCISIGEITSRELENYGISNFIQAEEATFDGVLKAILKDKEN